ncbi:uncharacterized protein LOC131613378 [Vicia villosa]|uniref:uncharacterized protein LOC131613378 n=1 Tax=Vicia villosa TaxID=3911 RepID=UPI00273B2A35|nr:uncharacterized protein LOC131613378 [Vicia villosa]
MNTNIKIILWNCRGAAGKDFFRYSKYYTDVYKPEIFVCMETRCDPKNLHNPLKKLAFCHFFSVDNVGYAGGIIVACKDEKFKVTLCSNDEQWIHLRIVNEDGVNWKLTAVYASPYEQKRKLMWDALKIIASTDISPWIVAGDFNDIASANEKRGGSQVLSRKCNIFRSNMEECNLHDLGSSGPKFTWRGEYIVEAKGFLNGWIGHLEIKPGDCCSLMVMSRC